MKLGIIITRPDPEAVYNALRLALYGLTEGDAVRIFFSGAGVEFDQIEDPRFPVRKTAREALGAGAEFFACGTCLRLREAEGSDLCPLSSLKDQYEIVRDSDRVITI